MTTLRLAIRAVQGGRRRRNRLRPTRRVDGKGISQFRLRRQKQLGIPREWAGGKFDQALALRLHDRKTNDPKAFV
jgi:hypothetical protein